MAGEVIHEWSGIRFSEGLTSWMTCTCGAISEHDSEANRHMEHVKAGTSGPDGLDAHMYAPSLRRALEETNVDD